MRVCLVCEGGYPYVAGGVSGWIQTLCRNTPDVEYVIWSVATTREEMSQYQYTLPDNVKDVVTVYMGDISWSEKYKSIRISDREKKVLRRLISEDSESFPWTSILDFFKKNRKKALDVLMSKGFYEICAEEYQKTASTEGFREYVWNMREMYYSLLNPLSGDIPQADIYHALSTGYAGVLASAASYVEKKPMILTEHGIYAREREEEIIHAEWLSAGLKELWIQFFKKLALITYSQASLVTCLFEQEKALQKELGCPESKIQIIPKGVDVAEYKNLKSKDLLKKDVFHIGSITRIIPSKDVKTMLFAFERVLQEMPDVCLWIMGDCDEDPLYYKECLEVIEALKISNVTFLGKVDIREYLPEMDLLLSTGINVGQPTAMLEGMAAGKAHVSTNVGDCKGLLEGKVGDNFGKAGAIVPIMDTKAVAETILQCVKEENVRKEMGLVGQKRVAAYYRKEFFLNRYKSIYELYGGKE